MKRSDLEWLLQLDGETYWIDPKGEFWVKFEVSRVEPNDVDCILKEGGTS